MPSIDGAKRHQITKGEIHEKLLMGAIYILHFGLVILSLRVRQESAILLGRMAGVAISFLL
jgi:hypothetical protein